MPALLAIFSAIAILGVCWGADTGEVKLVSLGDRDAVVISVNGKALESDLVAHKLRPSRLEAVYKYDGALPVVADSSSELVKSLTVKPVADGFMLTVDLADSVPTQGTTIYRESVVAPGKTAIEVFGDGGVHSPFQAAWLETGQSTNIAAAGFVPDGGEKPAAKATPAAAPVKRVTFDKNSDTLTIPDAGSQKYDVKEQHFPERVDITLPGISATPDVLGLVHKNLKGDVTYVEVLENKDGQGVTIRASLAPGHGPDEAQQRQRQPGLRLWQDRAAAASG